MEEEREPLQFRAAVSSSEPCLQKATVHGIDLGLVRCSSLPDLWKSKGVWLSSPGRPEEAAVAVAVPAVPAAACQGSRTSAGPILQGKWSDLVLSGLRIVGILLPKHTLLRLSAVLSGLLRVAAAVLLLLLLLAVRRVSLWWAAAVLHLRNLRPSVSSSRGKPHWAATTAGEASSRAVVRCSVNTDSASVKSASKEKEKKEKKPVSDSPSGRGVVMSTYSTLFIAEMAFCASLSCV